MLLGPGQTSRVLPAPLVSLLRSLDLGVHQLAIPIRNEPGTLIEGYALVRDEPFPHWALPRVRAIHALVRGLEVHLRHLTATTAMAARPDEDEAVLTPREQCTASGCRTRRRRISRAPQSKGSCVAWPTASTIWFVRASR